VAPCVSVVCSVIGSWVLQDRLERVDRFAFGDGHDLGAVLAVLV